MPKSHSVAAAALAVALSPCFALAAPCNPTYRGVSSSALLRFDGEDHGVLELSNGRKTKQLQFATYLSNGFSRKYLTLSDVKGVETAVLEKNSDFTASKNDPAAFVITPDLPIKYYYATIKDTSGLHDFRPDDTWTLIGCRS